MVAYLLDADVLSAMMAPAGYSRRRKIEAWLRARGDDSIILSSVSIAEINRGIALFKNKTAAAAILDALDLFVAIYYDTIVTPSHAEWQIFAKLSAVPELRHLCHGKNKRNVSRTGADLVLAIQATTLGHAIVTCNVVDFMEIDRRLPLTGGIFDPNSGIWARSPHAKIQ